MSGDLATEQLLENLNRELTKTNELKRIIEATIDVLESGQSFQGEIGCLQEMGAVKPGTMTALENVAENPAEAITNLLNERNNKSTYKFLEEARESEIIS